MPYEPALRLSDEGGQPVDRLQASISTAFDAATVERSIPA
jgi:hypothetical protein